MFFAVNSLKFEEIRDPPETLWYHQVNNILLQLKNTNLSSQIVR